MKSGASGTQEVAENAGARKAAALGSGADSLCRGFPRRLALWRRRRVSLLRNRVGPDCNRLMVREMEIETFVAAAQSAIWNELQNLGLAAGAVIYNQISITSLPAGNSTKEPLLSGYPAREIGSRSSLIRGMNGR